MNASSTSWKDAFGNSSSSSSNNHRSAQQLLVLPTLDLHGLRKPQAIRAVTDFLEQQERRGRRRQQQQRCHHHRHHEEDNTSSNDYAAAAATKARPFLCRIIAGAGSHSGATGGPTLRNAVEKLFFKRRMEFVQDGGAGSYVVHAGTGVVLGEAANVGPTDSKVVVMSCDAPEMRFHRAAQRAKQRRGKGGGGGVGLAAAAAHQTAPSSSSYNNDNDTNNMMMIVPGPSLAQVAREDKDMARAVEESRECMRLRAKETFKFGKELEQAVEQSRLMSVIQYEGKESPQLGQELQHAMTLSLEEEQRRKAQEEEALREALQLSRKYSQQELQEEDELQRAMEASLKSTSKELHLKTSDEHENNGEQDDELQHALEAALATSAEDHSDAPLQSEEEWETQLQEALAVSMRAATTQHAADNSSFCLEAMRL